MQPLEMETKTSQPLKAGSLAEQRAECRRRYQAGVAEFTEDEKSTLRHLIAILDPAVRKDYPLFADTPWNFLKVSNRIEGGLPHTRGKHIVLAEGLCRWLVGNAGSRGRRPPPEFARLLLLHEQMHVFQRATKIGSTRSTSISGVSFGRSRSPPVRGSSSINSSIPMPSIARGSFRSCDPMAQSTSGRFALSEGLGPKRMPADIATLAVHLTRRGRRIPRAANGQRPA